MVVVEPVLPGVGYVRLDGVREPTRVRAGYVTDQDIATMATDYGPHATTDGRPRSWGEQLFEAEEHAS